MESADLLGTIAIVGLCIALAAAGPSFLLWRAEKEIERLRDQLQPFDGKKTVAWRFVGRK